MKRIASIFIAIMMTITLIPLSPLTVTANAASGDKYSVNIKGTVYYNDGQKMLNYINNKRSSDLVLDKDLTNIAVQRATEISYNFSHYRPNGTICFTVSNKVRAENIAAGHSSASATFKMWMNSSSHRNNMLNSKYKRVGVAHFKQGTTHYWVLVLSGSKSGTKDKRTDTISKVNKINVVEKDYRIRFNIGKIKKGSDITLVTGKSYILTPGTINRGWTSAKCTFTPDSFKWTSSDPNIVKVSSSGKITAGDKPGNAKVIATVNNGSGTKTIINVKVVYPKFKVSFNANGGTVRTDSKLVTYNSKYGTFPIVQRKGYVFKGWYTKKEGGERVKSSSVYTRKSNQILYAHWEKITVSSPEITQVINLSGNKLRINIEDVKYADGYQFVIAKNKDFTSGEKTSTIKGNTKTFNDLNKSRYYVKVRAYRIDSSGNKVYSKYSATQSVIVKQ